MKSLRSQLNLGILIFAAVLFITLLILESYFIQRSAQFYVATRLEHDSETLLSALQQNPDGQYQLDLKRIHPIYQRPFSGHYFDIRIAAQHFRSRSLWDESLALPEINDDSPQLIQLSGPQQQPLLVSINRFQMHQHQVTIVVAESIAELTQLTRQAQLWSGFVASLLVLAFIALQYHWVKRSLSPLRELQQQLQALQKGQRQRLAIERLFSELAPLIAEMNQLIQALEERIKRSRNAIGNLAHALKTPLATLQQLSLQQPLQQEQLQRIQTRIDSELKRARIAGTQRGAGQIQVRDEIIDLLSVLKKIHAKPELQSKLQIPPETQYLCDRQDFLELCGNLLDNAYKWAHSRIDIQAHNTADGLWLCIEDDGPGCAPERLSQLTQRGIRLDETNPGHGLGLSIVQEIVYQYRGELKLVTGELGGLRAEVNLLS